MAMIYQSAAGASNADKITISMWCRAHTTNAPSEFGDYFELIEFGDPSGIDSTKFLNYIGLTTNTDGSMADAFLYNSISLQLTGAKESVNGSEVCTATGGTNAPGIATLYRPKVPPEFSFLSYGSIIDSKYTPQLTAGTGDLGIVVEPGKWFHLMIAADTSNETAYDGATNKLVISVNGIPRSLFGPSGPDTEAWTIGQMQPRLIQENEQYGENGLGPSFSSTASQDVTFNIPAFDFAMNGFEIGIPSQRDSANKNTQLLDMADVQIWVGKFIDPTNPTNFSKFVELVDGRRTPVNPDIAADYFGQQTYLFSGTRDDFLVNQGSGGAFSYSGTITSSSGVSY